MSSLVLQRPQLCILSSKAFDELDYRDFKISYNILKAEISKDSVKLINSLINGLHISSKRNNEVINIYVPRNTELHRTLRAMFGNGEELDALCNYIVSQMRFETREKARELNIDLTEPIELISDFDSDELVRNTNIRWSLLRN